MQRLSKKCFMSRSSGLLLMLAYACAGFSSMAFAAEDDALQLCYFSLNNSLEKPTAEAFIEQLPQTGQTVLVSEHMQPELGAKASFQRLLNSGQHCDGLVISGHHTGAFGGERASDLLSIDWLEARACEADNADFFKRVKALWLQGCRTLGAESAERIGDADQHMLRVGRELAEDHLPQSFAELNLQFSAALDIDNPLSSRYQRVFPNATSFGWTRAAPGFKTQSERSLIYHLEQLSQIASESGRISGAQTLAALLRGESELVEPAISAWHRHGYKARGFSPAYDNPNLSAFPPLASSGDQALQQAARWSCELRQAGGRDRKIQLAETILQNPQQIAFQLDGLQSLLMQWRDDQPVYHQRLKQSMAKSTALRQFLHTRLQDQRTGILRKIQYYSLWRDISGQRVQDFETALLARYHQLVAKPGDDIDHQNFVETLSEQLVKHELLRSQDIAARLGEPDLPFNVFRHALQALRFGFERWPDAEQQAFDLMQREDLNADQRSIVFYALQQLPDTKDRMQRMLDAVLQGDQHDPYLLQQALKQVVHKPWPPALKQQWLTRLQAASSAHPLIQQQIADWLPPQDMQLSAKSQDAGQDTQSSDDDAPWPQYQPY